MWPRAEIKSEQTRIILLCKLFYTSSTWIYYSKHLYLFGSLRLITYICSFCWLLRVTVVVTCTYCIRNGLRLNLLRRTILRKYLKISFQEPQFYILLYLRNHSNTINCILSLFIYHMTPGPKVGHTANIMALF